MFASRYTYSFSVLQGAPKENAITRAATSTTAAATETFAYDANGFLSSETDWNGNQTTYVNDSHGDPTSITEAAGSPVARTTTTTYDSTWVHLPSQIVTSGLTTAFTYDSTGEVLTRTLTDTTTQTAPYATQGNTRTWTYTWNNALLASATSPRTDKTEKTSYGYTGAALTSITNPLGQVTNITAYTGGGLPLTVVDANNVTTNLTYDPRHRLTSSTIVTAAGSLATKYGYDNAGNLTSLTKPDGSELIYTYDTAHRLTATTDLFGQSIQLTLDALGDATAKNILNAASSTTSAHSNTFDALGRMLTDVGASSQTATYAYDANGNQVSILDQLSNQTANTFDALNRIQQITDPAKGVTATTYDTYNRPLTITSPKGIVTGYVYDGFGDLIEETNPNTGATVYTYDNTGNRIKRVTAAGATTQYAYDALDRVLTVSYPADPTENVAYSYDESGHGFGVGRLTSLTDAAGKLSRSYDERGNLLSETRAAGTATLATAYTYDAASRVASIRYPSGALVNYTRDAMGRVTAVTTKPSGGAATTVASSLSYEPFGPMTSLSFGNGVVQSRSYDQDYRLTALNDVGSRVLGGRTVLRTLLRSLTYGYYATNNIASITDLQTPTNTQSFNYDALKRLQTAGGAYGSYQYGYDADGNRLSETLGTATTNYAYGAANDLLTGTSMGSTTMETFGYTADGRLATLSPGISSPANVNITSLSYNQAGQFAAAKSGSATLASYTYDGFGQRAAKTISSTAGARFVYNQAGMLLEETNAAGAAQADYIYLGGQPVAVLNGSALYYLHDDHLGTPQLATNSSQAKAWTFQYAPFGDAATASGTITQNLRLPGQYYDSETGWNHNGFRDYAPGLGRYIEPDPLGFAGSGTNLYAYTADNPIDNIDPLGLKKCNQKDCRRDAALKVIRFGEWGRISNDDYYGLYGGSAFSDDSQHPNQKITKWGHTSTSAGAYQINYPTWQAYSNQTGSHDFSPSSQDAYALWRINNAGAMNDVDAGNVSGMIDDLNGIWVSLPGGSQQRKGFTNDVANALFNKFYQDCMAGK
jgi:RHS repeat-associated protein